MNEDESKLSGLAASISIDAISILMGQLPTATAGESIKSGLSAYISRKAKIAHDILIKELASGQLIDGDFDPDRFFGLLFRYLNAVKQGAARRNLHLLAQIIRNGSKKSIEFEPDLLASNADIVSQLRKDEIQLVAGLWRIQSNILKTDIAESHVKLKVSELAKQELIPSVFSDIHEMNAVATSVSRTGLVVLSPVWGGTRVDLTKKMNELAKLCDLEQVYSC